ncbi:MAG: 50S ribosomal protein L10, partial [Actinomycetota bacterium]|nr:50S ribosomal protein L10 [Actinomycetota bacterium]
MNREQKAAAIEEVAAEIREADAVFAVDFRGISVKQSADLRGQLADVGAGFRVVKNRLTQRSADQAGAEPLKAFLEGPTAFAFVRGDAALAAKALAAFRRETQRLEFKGGTMDGQTLTGADIESIARLPARDVLYGQLAGVVASPLTGLVRGLGGLIQGLAVALDQIREQGLVGGGEAPVGSEREADAPATEGSDGSGEAGEGSDGPVAPGEGSDGPVAPE